VFKTYPHVIIVSKNGKVKGGLRIAMRENIVGDVK